MTAKITSIIRVPDKRLREISEAVDDFGAPFLDLVDNLSHTLSHANGYGVAAPQIGVTQRVFVYRHQGRHRVAVNPTLHGHSGTWSYREGCLSMPGFFWMLDRPKVVELRACDEKGQPYSLWADEIEGRLFQHEMDHLDGVLLPDRIRETFPTLTRQLRRTAERALAKWEA